LGSRASTAAVAAQPVPRYRCRPIVTLACMHDYSITVRPGPERTSSLRVDTNRPPPTTSSSWGEQAFHVTLMWATMPLFQLLWHAHLIRRTRQAECCTAWMAACDHPGQEYQAPCSRSTPGAPHPAAARPPLHHQFSCHASCTTAHELTDVTNHVLCVTGKCRLSCCMQAGANCHAA
jgi:hypothetical protein